MHEDAHEDAIEIQDLSKSFGRGQKRVVAVNEISFSVQEGEIFSLLGPNGAGKSTAFRILTTLSRPSSGGVKILGRDLLREPRAVREAIGYVPQSSGADENATGWENLIFIGRLYHLSKREARERAEELLALFDLETAAKRLVRTYSGGMRRRLDLACGLMNHPRVLLLDEPTAGLDPTHRSRVWNYIHRLNREMEMTMLFTTHYLDEADALAHRIAIIDKGSIVAAGEPEMLKDQVKEDRITLSVIGPAEDQTGGDRGMTSVQLAKEWLERQPYVKRCKPDGQALQVWVEKAQQSIPLILRGLDQQALQVTSMNLTRPTLDDVFLRMTGRND